MRRKQPRRAFEVPRPCFLCLPKLALHGQLHLLISILHACQLALRTGHCHGGVLEPGMTTYFSATDSVAASRGSLMPMARGLLPVAHCGHAMHIRRQERGEHWDGGRETRKNVAIWERRTRMCSIGKGAGHVLVYCF
jgi:hypothetical protein